MHETTGANSWNGICGRSGRKILGNRRQSWGFCLLLLVSVVDCHKEKGEAMGYNKCIIQTELGNCGTSRAKKMQNEVTMLAQ